MNIVENLGKNTLLIIIVAAIFSGIFKALYPDIPLSEALAAICILSIIITIVIRYFWSGWQKRKGKNDSADEE